MTNFEDKDMGYVRDFVSKIAEALVAATELPKQMEQIKFDMASLADDLSRTKTKNIELDTMLNDTRRQRDEAEQALSQAKSELSTVSAKASSHEETIHNYHELEDRLRSELEQAKKDRDDYGLKHMAAEDRANEAEAKLKKLREALGMPEAKPEDPKPSFQQPSHEAVPMVQAEVKPEPKRIYEDEEGYKVYTPGEVWDNEKNKYYHF